MLRTALFVFGLSLSSRARASDAAPAPEGVRTHLAVLAFSADGTGVLVRARAEGSAAPDAYEMWSTKAPVRQRFEIPAPASQLAASDPASCESKLGQLAASLKSHGFVGASVHKAACHKRESVVVVDKKYAPDLAKAQFKASGTKLVRDGYEIRFRSSSIGIYRDEALLCTLQQPKREAPAEIRVSATPGTKLVYVTDETSTGDQGLVGMCGGSPLALLE